MGTETVSAAENMPKPVSNGLAEWFVHDYIPRHCAVNGLDPLQFLDLEREPKPVKCKHCGKPLRFTEKMGNANTGEYWAWIPCPEKCDNPECQRIEAEQEARREHKERMDRLVRQMDTCGIPSEYRKATLKTYETHGNKTLCEAVERVRAYQDALDSHDDPDFRVDSKGLYLCGPTGTGKTHLAITIAKASLWHNHYTRFVESDTLIDLVKRANPGEDPLRIYKNATLLVIDDIGKEYSTPFAVKQLGKLINARISEGRPTIYTSNYMLRNSGGSLDLLGAMSQHGDADSAAAIVSRIEGSTQLVMVLGEDYRIRAS